MTCTRPTSVAPSSPASRPKPSGWPPASLDPSSGRHNPAAVESRSYKIKIPLSEVSTVSGDCLVSNRRRSEESRVDDAGYLFSDVPAERRSSQASTTRLLMPASASFPQARGS